MPKRKLDGSKASATSTSKKNKKPVSVEDQLDSHLNTLLDVTEINQLDDKQLDKLKELVENCLNGEKESNAKQSKHSQVILQALLPLLFKLNESSSLPPPTDKLNQIQSVNIIFSMLNLIKMESLSVEFIASQFESICSHLIKTNTFYDLMGDFVAKLGSFLNKCSSKQSQLFNTIFMRLLSSLNSETLLINMLKLFNKSNPTRSKEIADMFMQKLFAPRNTNITSPENIVILVEHLLIMISSYSVQNRPLAYENLIKIFLKIETKGKQYFVNKCAYLKAEQQSIVFILSHLTSKDSDLDDFLIAIDSLFNKYSVNPLTNRFLFALIIAISACQGINDTFQTNIIEICINRFEFLVDLSLNQQKENAWISFSLKNQASMVNFINTCKCQRLKHIIDNNHIVHGLTNFCFAVLYKCDQQRSKIDTYSIELIKTLLDDLFGSFIQAREVIISKLLDQIFKKSNQPAQISIYMDCLSSFLTKKLSVKFFNEPDNKPERNNLASLVLKRLAGLVAPPDDSMHKNLTEIASAELSVDLLSSIAPLIFMCSKSSDGHHPLNHLINMLKKLSNNADLGTRRLAIYSLVSIIKSLNLFDLNQDQPFIAENMKLTSFIFELLKVLVSKYEQDASIKSYVYQSFYYLINFNSSMINHIIGFLINKLNDGLIVVRMSNKAEAKHALLEHDFNNERLKEAVIYFNLDECVSERDFKLTEPLDVLFHCAELCLRMAKKRIRSNATQSQTLLNKLSMIIKTIMRTYLQMDSKAIFQIYKQQLSKKLAHTSEPIKRGLKVMHQLELGILDVLLDSLVASDSYNDISKLVEKHQSTANLISIEIEEQYAKEYMSKKIAESSAATSSSSSSKRKHAPAQTTPTTSKKSKLDENNNKENESIATRLRRPRRAPLTNITNYNTAVASSSIAAPRAAENVTKDISIVKKNTEHSFVNIQFDYTPRISYASCWKLSQYSLCSSDTGNHKAKTDSDSLQSLISLIVNDKFNEFVIKLTENKIKMLLATNSTKTEIYDPQSYDMDEIFNFVANIWIGLSQRINTNSQHSQRFCTQYHLRISRFIVICQNIWNIVLARKYHKGCERLIECEANYLQLSTDHLSSSQAKKIFKQGWSFLSACSNTIKHQLHSIQPSSQIIIKDLLAIMYDVAKIIELDDSCNGMLIDFLFSMAEKSVAKDLETGQLILKFLVDVSNKFTNSAYIIKYLSLDYHNYVKAQQELPPRSPSQSSTSSTESQHDQLLNFESNPQFKLFESNNLLKYNEIIHDYIQSLFNKFSWTLNNQKLFNINKLCDLMLPQIHNIILTLNYTLKAASSIESAILTIKSFNLFYKFLSKFFKQINLNVLDSERFFSVRELVNTIWLRLNSEIATQINRIQGSIINNETQNVIKSNNQDIAKVLEYKYEIDELIGNERLFDCELNRLNKELYESKEISLIEKYKSMKLDLKLNFENRIMRTITDN